MWPPTPAEQPASVLDAAVLSDASAELREESIVGESTRNFDTSAAASLVGLLFSMPSEDRTAFADAFESAIFVDSTLDAHHYEFVMPDDEHGSIRGEFWVVMVDGARKIRLAPPGD